MDQLCRSQDQTPSVLQLSEDQAEWQRLNVELATLEKLVAVALDRRRVLRALEMLIWQYLPLLFVAGHDVRDCHWNPRSRVRGSGIVGRRVLLTCLVLQLGLQHVPPTRTSTSGA